MQDRNGCCLLASVMSLFCVFRLDMVSMGKQMAQELLTAFPGIDEAMSFAEVMR